MRTIFLLLSGVAAMPALALAATTAATSTRENLNRPAVSEAEVQKAVGDYKRTADQITSGSVPKSLAEPFKPNPALKAVAENKARIGEANASPAVPNAIASTRSPNVARLAKEAETARAKGDWKSAVATWNAVEVEARRSGDREAAAQAAFTQARMLQAAAALDPAVQRERQAEIITKYRDAIQAMPRTQQANARNNLAVVYLQEKKPAEAATVMREMDWTAVEPPQLALCRYNFARAEETGGNVANAVKQYRLALEQEPHFAPALDGAFRVLSQAGEAAQLAELAEDLVRRNEAMAVAPRLRDALATLGAVEKSDALVVALVRAFAAAPVTPPEYARDYATALGVVANKAPALRAMIEQIGRAYAGDFPVELSGGRIPRLLAAWVDTPARRQAMSRLLQSLGDSHGRPVASRGSRERSSEAARANPQQALAHYLAAWSFDWSNTDAPVYASAVLQENRSLDANGALLGALIDQLFRQKGDVIGIPVKTPEDLRNLMRLHLVLATIYEREGRWGPAPDPRSAAFQLSHAIAAEEQLRKTEPDFAVSADLYARAGRACERAGAPVLALEFHTKAAEAYLYFRDGTLARQQLAAAKALRAAPDTVYQARLADVATKIDQL